eukprot:432256-Rhodomonas_salina.2
MGCAGSGWGVMRWTSGEEYAGQWHNDLPNGLLALLVCDLAGYGCVASAICMRALKLLHFWL